jgi:hypothetical protein
LFYIQYEFIAAALLLWMAEMALELGADTISETLPVFCSLAKWRDIAVHAQTPTPHWFHANYCISGLIRNCLFVYASKLADF